MVRPWNVCYVSSGAIYIPCFFCAVLLALDYCLHYFPSLGPYKILMLDKYDK